MDDFLEPLRGYEIHPPWCFAPPQRTPACRAAQFAVPRRKRREKRRSSAFPAGLPADGFGQLLEDLEELDVLAGKCTSLVELDFSTLDHLMVPPSCWAGWMVMDGLRCNKRKHPS